jgi:arsenate reductase
MLPGVGLGNIAPSAVRGITNLSVGTISIPVALGLIPMKSDIPDSRRRLLPGLEAHADLLCTSFDRIDASHREAGETLVEWIVKNHREGEPLHVTVICTGNSRRSILGATMGNVAAAYAGMPEVRFHSGGTAPTAVNPRTIACLKAIGVEIVPTGLEAPRGEPKTANPIYRVRWGRTGEPAFEATEFSKTYFDPSNPQSGFAALLVCDQADAGCPRVEGASVRISMPYPDPKIHDDDADEAARYAERRDDIGRLMLCVMMQARHRLSPR